MAALGAIPCHVDCKASEITRQNFNVSFAKNLILAGLQIFLQCDMLAVSQVPHSSEGFHGPLEQALGQWDNWPRQSQITVQTTAEPAKHANTKVSETMAWNNPKGQKVKLPLKKPLHVPTHWNKRHMSIKRMVKPCVTTKHISYFTCDSLEEFIVPSWWEIYVVEICWNVDVVPLPDIHICLVYFGCFVSAPADRSTTPISWLSWYLPDSTQTHTQPRSNVIVFSHLWLSSLHISPNTFDNTPSFDVSPSTSTSSRVNMPLPVKSPKSLSQNWVTRSKTSAELSALGRLSATDTGDVVVLCFPDDVDMGLPSCQSSLIWA